MNKLKLNNSPLQFEPESSVAAWLSGFALAFSALHMEVVKEQLEREFGLDLIASAPAVQNTLTDGSMAMVQNPDKGTKDRFIKEPFVRATMITPSEFLGNIIVLLDNKREYARTYGVFE